MIDMPSETEFVVLFMAISFIVIVLIDAVAKMTGG
jgi:hypothetical protein